MKVFGGSQFQSIAVLGRPPYISMYVLVYILSRCSFPYLRDKLDNISKEISKIYYIRYITCTTDQDQ
jgi:hypothetical protein